MDMGRRIEGARFMIVLLLLDELNPRAVGFQMAALFDHVETLPRNTPRPFRTHLEDPEGDLQFPEGKRLYEV